MASIQKREGKYRVRYRDPSGRSHGRSFSRKVDADRFAREVEVDMERGDWFDPQAGQMLVREWAETWLKASMSLSPTTVQTYRRDLDDSVLPRFGATRLSKVTPEDIEAWLADELELGIAPSSVHRHYRTLRRLLQVAVERDRIAKNPCVKVRPPRVQLRPMAILTWHEGVALAEAHPPHLRPLIYLALDSGMRWSELVGLRRSQLDLERRKVRVTEQLIRLNNRTWFRTDPKTAAGVRSITISTSTTAMLKELLADRDPGPETLVFQTTRGTPLIHSSYQTHFWKLAQGEGRRELPLPRPAPHQRRPGHRRRRPPQGDPGAHGPQLDHRHPRPLRPPLPRARRSDRRRLR